MPYVVFFFSLGRFRLHAAFIPTETRRPPRRLRSTPRIILSSQEFLQAFKSTRTVVGALLNPCERDMFKHPRLSIGGSAFPSYLISDTTSCPPSDLEREYCYFYTIHRVILSYFDPREQQGPHQLRRRRLQSRVQPGVQKRRKDEQVNS